MYDVCVHRASRHETRLLKPMQTPAPQGLISAEQLQSAKTKLRSSKSDSRYWLPRVYRPTNSQGKASPHYAMQVQFKGRHLTFGLYTGNREAAARRASRIYDDLGALGVEATVEKHRAKRPEVTSIATVGEYLRAARSVMSVRPVSFAGYSRHLYQIVGDIIDARGPRKARHAAIEAHRYPRSRPKPSSGGGSLSLLALRAMPARRDRQEFHATASFSRLAHCFHPK